MVAFPSFVEIRQSTVAAAQFSRTDITPLLSPSPGLSIGPSDICPRPTRGRGRSESRCRWLQRPSGLEESRRPR
ncbi:hypothetical protein HMPREF9583_00666 [Cutibacterium acnes HL038PA1]|nr:hypothetical protein HMPREF9583_00666 [Cutibacterium acnes HL038PA1]